MADMDLASVDALTGLPWTQDQRLIELQTPLGKDKLLLTSVVGEESISELFHYDIGMVSTDHAISPESLIGQPLVIRLGTQPEAMRWIHGRVAAFRAGPVIGQDLRYYSAEVVPWLWYLTKTTDCRIYQNLTAPAIIQQVFQTYGFTDFKIAVSAGDYPTLQYCVQYRESAFNFVSRLMEHEGIFYFFRHTDDKHTLIVADKNISFNDLPDPTLVFGEEVASQGHVTGWDHLYSFKPGRWAQTDYNFETPTTSLLTNEKSLLKLAGADAIERFDFPGDYLVKDAGTRRTRLRMEAEEAGYHIVRAASANASLAVGGKFTLQRHPCEDSQQRYVILRVRHEASDVSYLNHDASELPFPKGKDKTHYENTFEAMPDQVLFRPPTVTEKPVVHGPQTATVVGPAGEKIFTDKHARVRVQFHWDRYGKNDDQSSCWIRVSQAWAGHGWGNLNLPHVGHEVVVSFLEGDPDRPLITGRVYNGDNMNSIGLPDNKTQSTIRDHSGNEITMEGKAGVQDIRVHAVKDMHVTVDHDRDDHVKNDRSYTVDGTSTETITKKTSITITQGDYSHTVSTGTATITVKGKVSETFQDSQATTVTQSIAITSQSSSVHVTAATDIVLEVGASKLAMYSDGRIELSGKAIGIKGSDTVNTSGMSIKSDAGNDHSVTGAIVLSSGSVSNTVKGAMVMLNP
jgi:type VI secretion system secreted protein VgrG